MSKTEVVAPMPQLSLSERVRYGLETAGFFLIIGFFRLFDLDRASAHRRLDRAHVDSTKQRF